ncbi:MAG: helix-turn-helix transcriptional regulator [Bacteroidota bacterium]
MATTAPLRFTTIAAFHQFRSLPKPEHPLISVLKVDEMKRLNNYEPLSLVQDFYCIALKKNFNVKMKYGQQEYDFDEGVMSFMAPGQVFSISPTDGGDLKHSGWMLLIHPDFLWNTSLAKKIKKYEYFDYSVHEALFLSEKEEDRIASIIQDIAHEYHGNMDQFSQDLIVTQLEVLLTYAERFYQRQFLTRRITNHKVLDKLERLLAEYFRDGDLMEKGLPSVSFVADGLNVSSGYLSGMLKVLTGKSTQHHIHDKVIEIAKEQLSTTTLSVSEIAYALGFGHPQSFSKLFKSKTSVSPLDFRNAFN